MSDNENSDDETVIVRRKRLRNYDELPCSREDILEKRLLEDENRLEIWYLDVKGGDSA